MDRRISDGSFTWLVTGGAGFLGIHVCKYLIKKNQKVISNDIDQIPAQEKPSELLELTADIRNNDELKKVIKGVDYVVHCAGALALATPEEIDSVNVKGTKNVLDVCVDYGVKRFVYISSTAVYGMP